MRYSLFALFCLASFVGCGEGQATTHGDAAIDTSIGDAKVVTPSKISGWQPVGIGGGGAFFHPAASPHDPKLLFVSSDMGGFYRSDNGGQSWQMLPWTSIPHSRTPIFHPQDQKTIYACAYYGNKLRVSRDAGLTWQIVLEDSAPWKDDVLLTLSIHPSAPISMLLAGEKGLYMSVDAGQSWGLLKGSPPNVFSLHFDQTSSLTSQQWFAASEAGVFRGSDGVLTWRESSKGLPWRDLRAFWASSSKQSNQIALYCTIPSKKVDGKFTGGVYKSTDKGNSWQSAMGEGIHTELGLHKYGESDIDQFYFLGGSDKDPNTVYVTNRGTGYDPPHHYTVFRTQDGGQTWKDCFFYDPRFPENNTDVGWLFYDKSRGFGDYALGFTVNSGHPDQVIYTNFGEAFVTNDAGKKWTQQYSQRLTTDERPGKNQRWNTIGLEDTSCWRYVVDPTDAKRHYICYTDIGFARSTDAGTSWIHADDGIKWRNTVYDIAFDKRRPGRIWAACSNQHDIPTWRYIQGPTTGGGVCVSDDFGEYWEVQSDGLPEAPVTSIVVDSDSDEKDRTLYAGVYGHGVYRSDNDGKSWQAKASGIEPTANRQVVAIQRHADGGLFCSVAGRREGRGVATPLSGGIYRSRDRGASWKRISSKDIFRPVDFFVDPKDSNVIYVAAMDGMGHSGGVYRTANGGKYWHHSVPDFDRSVSDYIECYAVSMTPGDDRELFLTTLTHGIFRSKDLGRTWEAWSENAPSFKSCLRMTWDEKRVWVSTLGGGVWKFE